MKTASVLTAAGIATIAVVSFAQAQAKGTPPVPRPAAGALPTPSTNAIQKSFRTQTPDEQRLSQQTSPLDVTQVGQARNPR